MKKATAAVIVYENKILIAQRMKDGLWEFPGGKIEDKETPAECVVREMKEELDLEVEVKRFLGLVDGVYRNIPMQVYAFLVELKGENNMRLHVHKAAQWLPRLEIEKYPLVDEDKVILEEFL